MITLSLFLTLALPPRSSDPQAVLDAAAAKLSQAKSAVGTVVFPAPPGATPIRMEFKFGKPNYFITILGTRETWCDGKAQTLVDTKAKDFQTFPAGDNSMPRFAWGFDPFFPLPKDSYSIDHPADGTFAGKPAVVAEFHSQALRTTVHVAFDPATDLPVGFTLGAGDQARDYVYQDIKLDTLPANTNFKWAPPAGFEKHEQAADKLLRVGTKVPDFTLSTPDGKSQTLYDALKGKKGLLLNFFFVDCNPCRAEFPHLQAMYPGLKDQGFAYLSVNNFDLGPKVAKFIGDSGYTFPVVLNGTGASDVAGKYGVAAYPTNLIIAPDGTITARFVGFDEDGLKTAIRKLGLKLD